MKDSALFTIFMTFIMAFTVLLCRNVKQAKSDLDFVKILSNKVKKSSEKVKYVSRYEDDIVRTFEFVKIDCPECNGSGYDTWDDACEECDGDGFKYRIQAK